MIAAWVARFDRVGLLQTLSLVAFALCVIGFALSRTLPVAIVFLTLAGLAEMLHATSNVTTLQMGAPEHMRGRVASILPIFPAFISIGALTAGASADLLGAPAVVSLFAVAAVLLTAGAWLHSEPLRRVRLSGLIASGQKDVTRGALARILVYFADIECSGASRIDGAVRPEARSAEGAA